MSEAPKRRRRRLSRRDLLKALPVAGVAAASASLWGWGEADAHTAGGVCRLCTNHCGIRGTVRGDRLERVEGDPASDKAGFVCLHGMALRELVHSRDRLREPLERVGGELRPTTWEQALPRIAEAMRAIAAAHGPEAVAVQSGWPFVRHPFVNYLRRFAHAFGSPNIATVASLCEATSRMGKALVAGAKFHAEAAAARTLVLWGANPPASAPPFARTVLTATERGRRLIVIDPLRTEAAERATLHLQVRPGTDGALALGMLHVVLTERLYDAAFAAEHVLGLDALAALAADYPPGRVAGLTSVPAQDVVRAARLIARGGPTAIWTGLGLEHHASGVQTVRAVAALAGLCGHLDVPGGGRLYAKAAWRRDDQPLPALYRLRTPEPVPPPPRAQPIGHTAYPLFELFNREAQANLFPTAILDDRPYPLRGLLLFGSNPFVTSPGAARWRAAADRLDLLVSVDPFLTASGALADFVLPAATFLEGRGPSPADQRALRSPMLPERHDSRSDWAILRGLAQALDLGRYFPWASLEEALAAPAVPWSRAGERTLVADRRPAGAPPPRFPTASGKLELTSAALARFGHAALPTWRPPAQAPDAAFPLWLVTGPRTAMFINSQLRQLPSVRTKQPAPTARLHPTAAAAAGVADGDRVAVVSPHGRIVMRAHVSAAVHPECVVVPAGWEAAGANALTSAGGLDPISGFPVMRSAICRVEPAPAGDDA